LPNNQLPDPGLVFDTLLKRERFVEHPGGLSSLMFSFATLVIHSIFRTSLVDTNVNETSSYVDLAPLYGNDQAKQNKIRIGNGRGLLHPDTFAEDRLLMLPPAVCALLVLFNRNHNYIAARLFEINERGTFVPPESLAADDPASKQKIIAQDEELFQTARLINAGWFGTVVFTDYFSTILGLVRDGLSWSLEPFEAIRNSDHSPFERGKGNSCSAEFNCLYRWHATTSQEDEQWTEKVFGQLFPGKPIDDITSDDFRKAALGFSTTLPDPCYWTFGGLQRQPNGRFKDEDLAYVIHNATQHPAATFGARGTPTTFRFIEILGIQSSRKWGVCSLNNFRQFLGLKTFSTFLEWNSNPEIANAAEQLYGNIERLELYVGLQAEEVKPLVDGAGLCPGYTVSRAILSDAIALTRGDRYFTHDFTPYNLTGWGFADCQRDPNAFGFGSTLSRLFIRTLPNHFTENSVYAFFPLMTPDAMKTNLAKLGLQNEYDFARPAAKSETVIINTHARVAALLKDKTGFVAIYKSRLERVLNGPGFFPVEGEKEQQAVSAALNSLELVEKIGQYFYETTRKVIFENAYTLVGGKVSGVDLVRQVLRVVPIYWVAVEVAGIKLKTKDQHGDYTASELFDILGDIYTFIFLDVEASKIKVLQAKVEKDIQKLLDLIKDGLGISVGGVLRRFFMALFNFKPKPSESRDILQRLNQLGHSTDQLANTILALMVTSSVEITLATTNTVNMYLDSAYIKDVTAVAKATDKKTQLNAYVLEALRLNPSFLGVFRTSSKDQIVNGQEFKKNTCIFLDTATSNVDPSVFQKPGSVDITRAAKDYLFADGAYNYLGETLTVKIAGEVIRAVFSLDGICRAPGQSGVLPRFQTKDRLDLSYGYLNSAQSESPWPTSLSIQFNAVPQK
jgi:cytochrome P450